MHIKKINRWAACVLVALTAGFMGCSTSGGEQKSVMGNKDAESDVKGDVAAVNSRTQDVFKDMGISISETQLKNSGNQENLEGKAGDKNVSVELSNAGNGLTHVEITAKEGAFQWDQDYAHSILAKIMEKS